MIIERRAFLTGLISAIAAPAVVRAEILMPVRSIMAPLILTPAMFMDLEAARIANHNQYLTMTEITKHAVKLWKNTNLFINDTPTQYDTLFPSNEKDFS